ncbi:hypothetical protein GGF46_001448 [Coemansia sp. RSA 552]|nr:hypothetical protein GGF46_001448 [Coemansia sp. RSA 552]
MLERFELSVFVPSRADGCALETALVLTSAAAGPVSQAAAVFLHPYAPLGGHMENNVIQELRSSLEPRTAVSLAFNLRGASRSQGRTSWTGATEAEDVHTFLAMLRDRCLVLHPDYHSPSDHSLLVSQMQARGFLDPGPVRPGSIPLPAISSTLLVGYSYGAMLAASIPPSDYPPLRIEYTLISYPYSVLWALALHKRGAYLARLLQTVSDAAVASSARSDPAAHISRTLLVYGSSDNFTSARSYERWLQELRIAALGAVQKARAPSPSESAAAARAVDNALTAVDIPHADHGWVRREQELADVVTSWWQR